MRALTKRLAVAIVVVPASAHADSGALFGESSRAASLADSVTARPGDTSAIFFNPGAVADLDRPTAAFTFHAGTLDLWYRRAGEPKQDQRRTIAGFGVSLAAPIPIGPAWLRTFAAGVAFHVPAQHALRLTAPSRPDQPSFPLYGDRAERTAATAVLATRILPRMRLGVGVTLAPNLSAPTRVGYDPNRGDTPDEHVTVDLDRALELDAAWLGGIRAQPLDWLSLGLAYRQAIVTRAYGPNDTVAGGLVVHDQIDFYDFLAPEELAAGVALFDRARRIGWSLDVVRARWSRYRTIHDAEPVPRFSDVTNVRSGIEWSPARGFDVRAGYAYEPTPVPEQIATTNLLDADRHVLALGGGFDLRSRGWAALRIDAHVRTHVLATRESQKQLAALPDDDPATPGRQIGNLGYPSIAGSGSYWELGFTITGYLPAGDAR